MKFEEGYQSRNVEDRRGGRRTKAVAAGGGGVVLLILALIFGPDVLKGTGGDPQAASAGSGAPMAPGEDPDASLKSFVSFVLDDVQRTWSERFPKMGKRYQEAKLVLFSDQVDSACGGASAAIGPFYCPADQKAYIDLTFYRALDKRFGAPGDFAQAYVIAHEIGHHVQNLLGTNAWMRAEQRRDPARANELSVRMELQADCLAGVWAHDTKKRDLLEKGDIKEGLDAASAIGDDTLQKRAGARVTPESWTHGSSDQRVRWFKKGMKSGRVEDCDTFAAQRL